MACGDNSKLWKQLVTLDQYPECKPDVVHNLEVFPYPFADDTFDEVHAYEVLEHLGRQGDYVSYFAQFSELWRILKPGGYLAATCPSWRSIWAFGDPSHTRVINSGSLVFLNQRQYIEQVGKSAMTDFRRLYRADFEPLPLPGNEVTIWEDENTIQFILQAVKPSRINSN